MTQVFLLVKFTLAMMNRKIFQPIFKTFMMPPGLIDTIVEWESKGQQIIVFL